MTAAELADAGERLYGANWRGPLAKELGVDATTLWRWTNGGRDIPGPAALAVRLLLERKGA